MSEISSSNKPQKRHLSGGESPDIREKTRAKTTDSESMDIDPPTMSSSGPPVNVGIGPIIDNNKSPPTSDSGTEDLLDRNADIPLGFLHAVNTVLKKQFPQNKEVDNERATSILSQCYQLDALHRIGNLDLRKGAFDLVEEYPGIIAICQEAVRTGDFKNIFRLKPFQIAKIVPKETLHDTQLYEASKMGE
ncbi:hypothetical protein BDN70DRAFT_938735 [Pholiota conissans]|uniref:Uncharacterized protein n=1 Tax=Pholiota conissans TaxID=109636 RepID=A0A9P6CLZ0_9AGAR|nr:hypothetical protein BDN70DRAFT_938735 [Pholiota conissans]